MAEKIGVEVAYARPDKQKIVRLEVDSGTTLRQAVDLSGIVLEFPEINPDDAKYGIFGKAVRDPSSTALREGDRVEIYRPLLIDPKQARANRAAKTAKKDSGKA